MQQFYTNMMYSYPMAHNHHHHRQFLLIVITRHHVSITNTLSQPLNNRYLLCYEITLCYNIGVMYVCVQIFFHPSTYLFSLFFPSSFFVVVVGAPHKWQVFNVGIHE